MSAAFIGILTWYALVAGAPLYCDSSVNDLTVGTVTEMWIAIPVELYSQGWQCGDLIVVFHDDTYHYARAYDAGPFGSNCVMQVGGGCIPIIADIPGPFVDWSGMSTNGKIINISAGARRVR